VSARALSLTWRPIDPATDAPLLHDWVTRPYARFWGQQHLTAAELEARYRKDQARGHDRRLALRQDTGEAVCLIELYDPQQDELARHYPVSPGDRGLHLLLGPPNAARAGQTHLVISDICAAVFADPAVHRLVCEPDLRNQRVIARLLQAGFQRVKVVYLPHKIAQLMTIDRSQFEARRAAETPPLPTLRAWPVRVFVHRLIGRVARARRQRQG